MYVSLGAAGNAKMLHASIENIKTVNNNNMADSYAAGIEDGFWLCNRESETTHNIYRNSNLIASITESSSGVPDMQFITGGYSLGSGAELRPTFFCSWRVTRHIGYTRAGIYIQCMD